MVNRITNREIVQRNGPNNGQLTNNIIRSVYFPLREMRRDGYLGKNKYTPHDARVAENLRLTREMGNVYKITETGMRLVLSGIDDYDAFLTSESVNNK